VAQQLGQRENGAAEDTGSYGQITRPKIVLRASPLFLFISFSIWIIFIMGEPVRTHSQDDAERQPTC
jgi:hypothetical protein